MTRITVVSAQAGRNPRAERQPFIRPLARPFVRKLENRRRSGCVAARHGDTTTRNFVSAAAASPSQVSVNS